MEGIILKRMIGVNKRTRTTNLLYALGIEPVEMKIKKIKMNFAKRLFENKFTKKDQFNRLKTNNLMITSDAAISINRD